MACSGTTRGTARTGCMSQYQVVPEANDSPVNVGTMARDAWFEGAIGKLAIYDRLLTQAQITAHYRSMTGDSPTGSCDDTAASERRYSLAQR